MKKVLVLLTLLISFNLISQNLGWRINKLPGDNFKITNQDDILNSWTAFLNADGTYTYVNDRDPLQSFSEKINFDGSVTTVNDFNVLESFTTRYNSFNDTFSITDDFDPLNSSTARTNFDGSVTVTDDFPNSNISDNIGFVITNPTRSSSTGPDLDLIQGAADVANSGTVNIDYDSPEWTAAGYGIALLISTPIEQRGGNRSIGLTVGYNGGITAGLDLFFDKVSVGAHYGSKLMEDNDLVFVNEIVAAGTLGFKVSDNLYIKGGIGSYYDQVDIWSYGDGADQYLNTYQNDGKTYFTSN